MSIHTNVSRDAPLGSARSLSEGESLTETAAGTLEHYKDRAGNLVRRAKDRAVEKERELEGYVTEHPVKSVLIAAGVGACIGIVAGVMLSRR